MNVLCLYTYAVWHFLVCQKRFRAATTSIGSVETLLCVCVCVFVCRVDLPLCQYVRTHVYTGFEYLQQQQQQLVVAFLRFFCASSMYLVISYVRRLAILTAFADLFRL